MKILVIKAGALGDVIRCTFIAQALKDKYKNKNLNIYWLTDRNAFPFFYNNPYIKNLIDINGRDFLKRIKFDMVINLEEDEEVTKFASSINAHRKIGLFYENGEISPTSSAKEWFDRRLLEGGARKDLLNVACKKTYRQLISEMIGIGYEKYEPFIRLSSYQYQFTREFKKENNLEDNKMVVGMILGGTDRQEKVLPVSLSIKLITRAYKNLGCKIVLFSNPGEKERNHEILEKTKVPVIDVEIGSNMIDLVALINACNYVVATDTLGLHIALGLKKKTLCLVESADVNLENTYPFSNVITPRLKRVNRIRRDYNLLRYIDIMEVVEKLKEISRKPKLGIVITSFKEPKTGRAIEAILNQKINYDYDLIISAPDEDTLSIVRKYAEKNKKVKIFKDPGKGKNLAFNLLLKNLNQDILIFTDGDVHLSENSINAMVDMFHDSSIGCVAGRLYPEESKEMKYGYWANFLLDSAHEMRRSSFFRNKLVECSGTLFGFRNNVVKSFPLDTAEDLIIPYYFWEKGYRIGYSDKALVYIKSVNNWKDWINQKTRCAKPHQLIGTHVNTNVTSKDKSFINESRGVFHLLRYPKNLKQFYWSIQLMFARLYMWMLVEYQLKIKKQGHSDAWKREESAR
jgi:ADP-heptose:LPS heptosyltransferase